MAKSVGTEVKAMNVVALETRIVGDLAAEGDLRLDGTLKGTLNCQGKLTIGPEGMVKGQVFAYQAEIMGQVEGEVTVTDMLTLKSTALIQGDLIMGRFSVEPGAMFTGYCKMNVKDQDLSGLATDILPDDQE